MADVKITELTLVTPVETDVFAVVSDPSGTPITKKALLKTILDTRLNYSINGTDLTLAASTAAQVAFPTTGDVFTVAANTTYEVEGLYLISKSGTTCTTSFMLTLGTATVTFVALDAIAHNAAANTTTATPSLTWINQTTATVINATAVGEVALLVKGLVRVLAAGTITPQIQFSAAPTSPFMKAGSYLKFTVVGTTNNVLGNVA